MTTDLKQLITDVRQRVLAGEQVPRDLLKQVLAGARAEFSAAASGEKKKSKSPTVSTIDAQNLLNNWN